MDSQRAFREGRYAANINILVVDDDITSLNIVSAMLKTWSYQVMTVRSPIDALAVLRKGKCTFDLVVTDLHMPQMNGLELQKVVREEFELPVIMMSADDKESVILKSLEGGVVYYIVKPVSKDDISMLWQYVQHRKKKFSNVTIEDIGQGTPGESAPAGQQLLQGPGELDDLECVTSLADDANRKDEGKMDQPAAGKKKMRKRHRDVDQEKFEGGKDRRLLAPKKAKVVWSSSLHNQFLMAIRHIGLDKAVPKRILEIMNVSGLTRENVASHLQKYRMFLRRVAEKARLSKCLSERVFRSSIAFDLPFKPPFNHVQREQYAEYLKQQLQMNDMGLTQPPSHNALAPQLQNTLAPPLENAPAPPLGTASHLGSSSLGQFQPNCNQQQPAALSLASSSNSSNSGPHQYHQLFGSGQSRLLMNNTTTTTTQQQQRPIQLAGNRMNQFSSQSNCGSGFEMQVVNNNVGNLGGYGGGLIMDNNGGNGLVNSGTKWMDVYTKQTQAKQLQHALSFTSNPFNFGAAATPGFSSPSINNVVNTPFNNENVGPSFGGATSQRDSAASGINSFMIGGHNGMVINNEVINGLSTGVQKVNLNGAANHNNTTSLVTTTTGNYASSARFGTNSANQLVSILPKNKQHGMSSTVGGLDDDFSYSTVMKNAARNFNYISLTGGDEDIMAINNLVLQQLDNETLPRQEQGGEDDIVTFNSMLYQEEDRVSARASSSVTAQVQPNTIRAINGQAQLNPTIDELQLNPAPTPIFNFQVPLNFSPVVNDEAATLEANPAGNGQLELHPTANQVGNLNLSSTPAANSQLVELNPIGNQVEYPNFASGPYPIEDGVNEDNFWNQLEERGGDTQMFDFQSEDDFSSLLDQFTTQDADDDFLNALMSF